MEKKNFNEVLKRQEHVADTNQGEGEVLALDNSERVKVLSPGRLVFNRFIRNKLAIIGSIVLICMFVFSFIVPLLYPYTQTELFYKYDVVNVSYAQASKRTEYGLLNLTPDNVIQLSVQNKLNATIIQMETAGESKATLVDDDGNSYILRRNRDNIYEFYTDMKTEVGKISDSFPFALYNSILKAFEYTSSETADDGFLDSLEEAVRNNKEKFTYGEYSYQLIAGRKGAYTINRLANNISYKDSSLGEEFETLMLANIESGNFSYQGKSYVISGEEGNYTVYQTGNDELIGYLTTYVFDAYNDQSIITDKFRVSAINSIAKDEDFEVDGVFYEIQVIDDEFFIYSEIDNQNPVAILSDVSIRAYDGTDSLSIEYKEKVRNIIEGMIETGTNVETFNWEIPQLGYDGVYEKDENGEYITELTEMKIEKGNNNYVISCDQVTYLIDIYGRPSKSHIVGTDGDGMDVLARMMYGGRVSLLVCFVVIIIQTILGVIMGGIAGYFGGWIDNLIMRLVDIFYCIPSMPILIITGALFDQQKMDSYYRLIWLMVILGILGWASVARLVRGQILSLREQEFMVAVEAVGLKTSRRIFKHLIPNVMPQLIVTASSGLGSIIITESTLSFLGLGIKHPLASWGTMINSVTSSSETMIAYTYIWVPVGLLICLTVIAFNFVGDGLRDAYDPKMKR